MILIATGFVSNTSSLSRFTKKAPLAMTWNIFCLSHPSWLVFFIIWCWPIHTNAFLNQSQPKINLKITSTISVICIMLPSFVISSLLCKLNNNYVHQEYHPIKNPKKILIYHLFVFTDIPYMALSLSDMSTAETKSTLFSSRIS